MGSNLSMIHTIKKQLFSPKYLLWTNVGISISLSAMGDVLEQHYEILKVYSILIYVFIPNID